MKLNKLYIAVFMTALFVGCDEYEDTVVPSPAVSADSPAVRFVPDNAKSFELEPSVSLDFDLTITRDNEAAALEVPVTVVTNTEDSFVVPSSVTFAAGSKTAIITISMADGSTKGIGLPLVLKLEESLTNPYKTEYATYYGSIVISDWADYATGTYFSSWYGESYAQVMQYSPVNDQYRFADLMTNGYDFVFSWDGATEITPVPKTVQTGYVHATYGMVSATTQDATYDAASKKFTFERKWTVAAGSFGVDYDTYTMD